jgi:hypothetical protein
MADVVLNNYSDDSKIKRYIQDELMKKVFHDIPLSTLNTGAFSIINEYISQATEQMAFTSSFYFNESFITKAVLPDSIYAEGAIFNIGYRFAKPSTTQILLELKLSDLFAITQNAQNKNKDTGLYEFILDKNTLINLKDGQTYSLDYDISFQYMNDATASDTRNGAWIVQYINDEPNSISVNKEKYISYRVTDNWLCLFINASEYTRKVHTVVNNMSNGVPNPDTVIECEDHICGFDIVYVETTRDGEKRVPVRQDHVLPIHATINDNLPYVHYIMDNSQTIRFMWQLQGNHSFIPKLNSRYEITIYTCHGKGANFTETPKEQPNVITSTLRFKNNANVLKAAFIISGSLGGTDIGTAENVRRKTIEAYNTANVISTDHDIEEWFKTFYFEHILFPFFFKRRDDPWGRIWSGFLALTDQNNNVYKTNTLHGKIRYDQLFGYNKNNISANEIVIPAGWVWTYGDDPSNLYTLYPYSESNTSIVETPKTMPKSFSDFAFANPFGVRIQKEPFAIGYFNPWINETVPVSRVSQQVIRIEDSSQIYHATPLSVNISRTYKDDYYHLEFWLDVSQNADIYGNPWVASMRSNASTPVFNDITWTYFKHPTDIYAKTIPLLTLQASEGYIPFDPEKTYLCVSEKNLDDDGFWRLKNVWIQDNKTIRGTKYDIEVMNSDGIVGNNALWGDNGIAQPIYVTGITDIRVDGLDEDDVVKFQKIGDNDYCTIALKDNAKLPDANGILHPIQINSIKIKVTNCVRTERTKYDEASLFLISDRDAEYVVLNVRYEYIFTDINDSTVGFLNKTYRVINADGVYIPYPIDVDPELDTYDNMYCFSIPTYESTRGLPTGTVITYTDMKPSPTSQTIDYYRIPFSKIDANIAPLYVRNNSLKLEENNLRVILHAYQNGGETGFIEMRPVRRDTDGTYLFETEMYTTDDLVDVDNQIHIASVDNGGGSWIPMTPGSVVNVNASEPEFKISILFKSKSNPDMLSGVNNDPSYNGYYINDEFKIDQFSLVQELKEMRSVVNFGEDTSPTFDQYLMYQTMLSWANPDPDHATWATIKNIAQKQIIDKIDLTDDEMRALRMYGIDIRRNGFETDCTSLKSSIGIPDDDVLYTKFTNVFFGLLDKLEASYDLKEIFTSKDENVTEIFMSNGVYYTDSACTHVLSPTENMYYMLKKDAPWNIEFKVWYSTDPSTLLTDVTEQILYWTQINELIYNYPQTIVDLFNEMHYDIDGGVEVQLMPFVEYSLMNSDKFADFVHTFTQVHKAIEPVIFKRLEGNNYLDCKLIATYGRPHTYCSDRQYQLTTNEFWPDLNVEIDFDVKLYNKALASNTLSELKLKVQAYFNRLTTVHTPADLISMNSNIYVSHLIQEMEAHDNVAYMKFKGWYVSQKNKPNSNYMGPDVQSIIGRWRTLEDMPKEELERFVPEMFILEDRNIVINVLDDFTLA